MDSRQQFEEWWASTPVIGENKRTIAEKAWQASRAAIVIEMPTTCASDDPYQIKREIIDELRDNGICTK